MNRHYRLLFSLVLVMLLGLPVLAQDATSEAAVAAAPACVSNYDATVDYFPDKVEPDYSKGWTVEYHNNYKVVDVTTPWPGAAASDAFRYILVECGTPKPEGYDGAEFIEIPAGKVIALGTSYIPQLNELGVLDDLIGVDSFDFFNTPAVVDMIAANKLIAVGSGSSVNVEAVLNADPGLILTFGSGSPDYDAHPALIQAGAPVVVASDYVEQTPLGQAEWIKFTSMFYDKEAVANQVFGEKADAYAQLVELTKGVTDQPLVLWNSYSSYSNNWFIPGSESFAANYVRDAGGKLVLGDSPELQGNNNALPFDFEAVYAAGLNADIWMPGVFGVSILGDLVAQDARYADFAAVKSDQVYNYDARENANGGNDYFETGVANPQDVLADLIKIFHPDLLPDHTLIYFRQLPPATN
ncbi:MAG: ABC transporter substrate-binding protein [Chloroflexi bacterium]|nr:ABC transporter substrate-binding protein [Chloroflexota bacterium]